MNLRNFNTIKDRRNALGKELNVNLKNIGFFSLEEKVTTSSNCENMIGVAQVPLGIAGPIKIKNQKLKIKNYYVPLATTEGALVASVNRGCKVITESGGVVVDSYRVGVTRGPVFKVASLKENDDLNNFLEKHFSKLQEEAAKTSQHLKLTRYFSRGLGRYRYIRFIFDTQDAMGMNMATIATRSLAAYIEKHTKSHCISLAGNYDVDKKPAALNTIEGRGIKVWAEVVLPVSVIEKTLKTTAQQIYDVWMAKCLLGSAMSGSTGFNAQFANIVAAIFIATGQDPAHVVEASQGITTCEIIPNIQYLISNSKKENALYISIYLPSLMVGTVGGGTGLETQKEALEILGIAGGNEGKNAEEFAGIIGAAVLAGEISLLASLAEGSLADAHQKLGRDKI